MPVDNLHGGRVFVLIDTPPDGYELSLAIVDENKKPWIQLAIEGRRDDVWYSLG